MENIYTAPPVQGPSGGGTYLWCCQV